MMGFAVGARGPSGAALTAAVAVVLSSCGGGASSPPGGPPNDTPIVPGAIVVTGTERLAWSQSGDASGLRFRAYVDGNAVGLDTARCDGAAEAECSAPLPTLATGVHTIAVSALSASGLESPPSAALTVQKVATRSVRSAASFPDARAFSSGLPRLESTVSTAGGVAFAADVVARALRAPLQLASTPDGRLLVAGADGLVRVVRPGEPDRIETALDARAFLAPPPAGPLGLALHPDFAANRVAYVAFLAEDGHDDPILRIVRLREAGDRLGEPATIFEAPVVVRDPAPAGAGAEGPRLAVGPDGLLYGLLPRGVEFDHEPLASRPHASMVRLQDDGRMPEAGPLVGIAAHPLGFTWHPATGVLWAMFPGERGGVTVRPLTGGAGPGLDDPGLSVLRMTEGRAWSSGALAFEDAPMGALARAGAFLTGLDPHAAGVIRLAVPILAEGLLTGISGRITDVVAAGGGTLFLAASSTEAPSGGASDTGDVVMRLRLR